MMENIYFFSDLEEKDLKANTEFGDERRYKTTRIGIFTFQREPDSPLRLKDVMFFLGLKNKLVYVVVFKDHGYNWSQVNHVSSGVLENKLEPDDEMTLETFSIEAKMF